MTSRGEMTDRELLQAYTDSGDRDSLGAFLLRYERSLVRYAGRLLGDPETAQDVVQEAFIQAARHPKRLLEAQSFHNWLLRVTRNIGVDHLRRDARARRHTEALRRRLSAKEAGRWEEATRRLEAEEARKKVRAAIDRLEPRYREVLLLRIQEEKSYREIAEITGLTVTNVGYLLHRSMKELSARLNHSREVLSDE